MPDNKLVIRRLPPCMSEEHLQEQLSPLPDHDYFCFFEANPGLGPYSFSRAYINFMRSEDMDAFLQKFDNHTFSDGDGHECAAVVEQAMWHKSPKNGPFYKSPETDVSSSTSSAREVVISTGGTIEEDPEFISFMEGLQSPKKRPQQSPAQNLESSADELIILNHNTNSKIHPKVTTPLINYVNQQRINKSSKRSR